MAKKAPVVYLWSWRWLIAIAILALLMVVGNAVAGYPAGILGGVSLFVIGAIVSQRWVWADYYRAMRR